MNTQQIIDMEGAHTSGVYPKRQLAIVRGEGAHVWDAEGRMYIDCVGGQGAANLDTPTQPLCRRSSRKPKP